METFWYRVKEFLGFSETNSSIGVGITLIFYAFLILFIILWIVEKIHQARKASYGKTEEFYSKRFCRLAFKTAVVGKLAVFIVTTFAIVSQAFIATSIFAFIADRPESFTVYLKQNKVFLGILGLLIIAEWYHIRQKKKSY